MISLETLALAKSYTESYVDEHGGGGGGGKEYVKYDNTAGWNAQGSIIAERGILYVYSDYASYIDPVTKKTVYVPGVKIGDGFTTLPALPFIDVLEEKLPSGGSAGDILVNTGEGPAWLAPANKAEQDNQRPITAAAVYNEIGTINVALDTI